MNGTLSLRALAAGLAGGFVANGLLGALYSTPAVHSVLYDPSVQSALFISLTPQRNLPLSVGGLIVLSAIHGWLYARLQGALPGRSWIGRGLTFGAILWAVYWLFQEWFIYVTLLGEPLALAAVELMILLAGALLEGLVIARLIPMAGHSERSAA